jgi:SSS family solute:Na+ symporter
LMNWGASYIVNDLYKPFVRSGESERHYVRIGRIGSVLIFAFSLAVAYYYVQGLRAWFLFINSVVFAFILPLSWLRFFWWRLNIYGEAAALIIGLPLGYIVWFPLGFSNEQAHPFWQGFLLLFGLGLIVIVVVSLLTPPERIETLREFYRRCRPPGWWHPVLSEMSAAERQAIRQETVTDLIDPRRYQHAWPALADLRGRAADRSGERRIVHRPLGEARSVQFALKRFSGFF